MSQRIDVSFTSLGHTLAGILERPDNLDQIKCYVLFAHCFTCGKDSIAAARISRDLADLGYAVLRFDFAGLGASEGDFSETNFSTKILDLLAAAHFLRQYYQAPKLLVGHSLGGRAVISAARLIPECTGVVTIGAPADSSHILKQIYPFIDEIKSNGIATVPLAGRTFTIKQQFIDDVNTKNKDVELLGKPLLIFHSPIDQTVLIAEAEKLYKRAKHPKSFVSLENANHLLTNKDDASYVSNMINAWFYKFWKIPTPITEEADEFSQLNYDCVY